ncbi:hypothetical protein GG344DRAFT_45795 [Lentinula edodes]|nr:hypothetical protein GG344DRAFT_45795 [Lentinula edodes]
MELQNTSTSFIVHSSPIMADSALLPEYSSFIFSPEKGSIPSASNPLLSQPPSTIFEEKLQKALHTLTKKYSILKEQAIIMQSSMVLNTAYCNRLREQLAAQEESRKRTAKGKLMGDGQPRLLTSREFVQRVEEFTKAALEKESAANEKRANKEDRAAMKVTWEKLQQDRDEQNKANKVQWKEDCRVWDENKKKGIDQGPQPKWGDVWFPPVPKPWVVTDKDKDAGNGDIGDDDDNNDTDSEDNE